LGWLAFFTHFFGKKARILAFVGRKAAFLEQKQFASRLSVVQEGFLSFFKGRFRLFKSSFKKFLRSAKTVRFLK
ncbi:MAG: hypothetical protein J6S51_04485, partial [Kiritimatiellae bacterium]|nr:hypothetical protein [Kiritimatiellia bacterium]